MAGTLAIRERYTARNLTMKAVSREKNLRRKFYSQSPYQICIIHKEENMHVGMS